MIIGKQVTQIEGNWRTMCEEESSEAPILVGLKMTGKCKFMEDDEFRSGVICSITTFIIDVNDGRTRTSFWLTPKILW